MTEHSEDIEHPVVLPAQPRERLRVLRGTVRRVTPAEQSGSPVEEAP